MSEMVIDEVVAYLRNMPDHLQTEVLTFAKQLNASFPVGVVGQTLLSFAGAIPPDEIEQMHLAIEEDSASVNLDEW